MLRQLSFNLERVHSQAHDANEIALRSNFPLKFSSLVKCLTSPWGKMLALRCAGSRDCPLGAQPFISWLLRDKRSCKWSNRSALPCFSFSLVYFLFFPSISLFFSDVTHEVCSHQVTFILIALQCSLGPL